MGISCKKIEYFFLGKRFFNLKIRSRLIRWKSRRINDKIRMVSDRESKREKKCLKTGNIRR